MAITRKPREPEASDPGAFDTYLRKGGSAASPELAMPAPEATKDVRFTLAIPGPLCAQLDRLRAQRLAKTSRHQWVLEAIEQRIQRETESRL
jgi:hypothetical protein